MFRCICIIYRGVYPSALLRLPVDNADALQHVGVLTLYKILLIYMSCIWWSA